MAVLSGVEEVAYRLGAGVAVSAVHGRHRTRPDDRWLDSLETRRTDGVLLILSELTARQHRRLDKLGVPIVTVDPAGTPPPGIPSVGATNWAGGLSAVEHLISLGHTRVAVIGGPTDVLCSRARVDGYRAAMGAAGLQRPQRVRALRRLHERHRLSGDDGAARPAGAADRHLRLLGPDGPRLRTRPSTNVACACPTT